MGISLTTADSSWGVASPLLQKSIVVKLTSDDLGSILLCILNLTIWYMCWFLLIHTFFYLVRYFAVHCRIKRNDCSNRHCDCLHLFGSQPRSVFPQYAFYNTIVLTSWFLVFVIVNGFAVVSSGRTGLRSLRMVSYLNKSSYCTYVCKTMSLLLYYRRLIL